MTGGEVAGGTTPPATGPDGQTLTITCPTCEGGGVVPEDHGQGNVEMLGCPDCLHPDGPGEGLVWRFWIDSEVPGHGQHIARDLAHVDVDPRGSALAPASTLSGARFWLREKEHGVALLDVSRAELWVVASARKWKHDREQGVLGADEPLRDAVADLERACDRLMTVEAARLTRS